MSSVTQLAVTKGPLLTALVEFPGTPRICMCTHSGFLLCSHDTDRGNGISIDERLLGSFG